MDTTTASMSKQTTQSINERLAALKAAHPDMIWTWHVEGGYYNDPRTYVYIRCVCPEAYCIWEDGITAPYCTMLSMSVLEDGGYTIIGAGRKISGLERMDWAQWDAKAAKARAELARLQKEVDALYDAANCPLSDDEYRRQL